MVTFGCPREAMDRIAAALGMSNEQLARSGLALDVLHSARWLMESEDQYPGFLDEVMIAAKNLQIGSVIPEQPERRVSEIIDDNIPFMEDEPQVEDDR
jgi:hypothetical protein